MEESTIPEAKYHKLASEYAKLRAQASVLKKAVLEEQSKNSTLRENLRQRETALRRAEQEVDSLGFRNKQLEHRVAVLQEELAKNEGRKHEKESKRSGKSDAKKGNTTNFAVVDDMAQDALIFEELQKKIMENAQLTSLIDDKERDLQLHSDRISHLEATLEKHTNNHNDLERRLRREIELLQSKNSELETKLVEAASMLGSEDALSVSGSENTPLHNLHNHHQQHAAPTNVNTNTSTNTAVLTTTGGNSNNNNNNSHTNEERITFLEKEVAYWRTQCEIGKLNETILNNINNKEQSTKTITTTTVTSPPLLSSTTTTINDDANCSCTTTAAGITIKPSYVESKSARDSLQEPIMPPTKEQLIYNNFSKKYEDLLKMQCAAESRVNSCIIETENIQNCLENATHELKSKDEQIDSINRALQMLEEDLTTTRCNYEEQISVLTEQVISLSEQLAACK